MNEQTANEQLQTTTPAEESIQQTTQSQEAQKPSIGGSAQQETAPQSTPAWSPNFKYSVKGVEKEIDPMFRDIIKDPTSEEKVRRLFEQVDGVDLLKQKYTDVETKYKDIDTKYNEQVQKLQYAAQLWEQDKDQFFEFMGLDTNEIYKWVAEKLRLEDAPENEKQLYTREQEARRLAMEREHQLNFYKERAAMEAAQAKSFQLSQELTKPDIATIVTQYDSIYGQGSFEVAVKQLGKTVWDTQKVDLSAAEAVSQVATYFKTLVDKLGGHGTSQAPQKQNEPPVIPTIKAGASSPAKRAVKSLDDIKKLAAQM